MHQRRSLDGSVRAAAVITGAALSADEAAGRRGDTSAAKVKDRLKKRNFGSLTKEEKKQVLKIIIKHREDVLGLVRRSKGHDLADHLLGVFTAASGKLQKSSISNSDVVNIIYSIYIVVETVTVQRRRGKRRRLGVLEGCSRDPRLAYETRRKSKIW